MKRKIEMNAEQAEMWLKKNPGAVVFSGDYYWYSAIENLFYRHKYPLYHTSEGPRLDPKRPYYREGETEEPKCEECERKDKVISLLSSGNLKTEEDWKNRRDASDLRRKTYELEKQLADLKAEKRKHYEWKNCGDSYAEAVRKCALRRRRRDGKGPDCVGVVYRRGAYLRWHICLSDISVEIPDPEKWEWLDLEGE